uniref:Uncharacterized protein n=1 Tax=Daphnia galeata TaxID=27404 RepID=A0A8J2RUZ5_9CRUS|nr:unnamed protein product [Daphnia galeata]
MGTKTVDCGFTKSPNDPAGLSEGGSHARVEIQVKTDTAHWTKVGQAHAQAGYQTLKRSRSHFGTC